MIRSVVYFSFLLVSLNAVAEPSAAAADQTMQSSLDNWCASARKTERQELQRRIIEICTGKGRSESQCQQEAAMYGSMNIKSYAGGADIPVCAQAEQFRKAHAEQK